MRRANFCRRCSGSSLATIIMFLPLAFLSGVTGAFFKFLSLTMASALVISFALTALGGAVACARGSSTSRNGRIRRTGARLGQAHASPRCSTRLFARPWLIGVGIAALLVGAAMSAMRHVGTGFLPQMDEGGFVLDYQTDPGTSLAETNRELAAGRGNPQARIRRSTPIRAAPAPGWAAISTKPIQGDFFVRLVDPSKRPPIWKVMDEIIEQSHRQVPGVDFDTHQLLERHDRRHGRPAPAGRHQAERQGPDGASPASPPRSRRRSRRFPGSSRLR